jgi:DNA-binding transcriptional LysR family regulator
MRKMPNFVLLRAFEVAARRESFTQAAEELHLTQSAISHQIRELEEHFGRQLFLRRNRRVELTPEGRRLMETLSRVFDAIEVACKEVRLAPKAQVLALHCSPSFAVNWLGPRLPLFMKSHPDTTIRMTSSSDPIDLSRMKELDIAISYGEPPRRAEVSVLPLGKERIVPLCAPALLKKGVAPGKRITQLPLIDSPLSKATWADWFSLNRLQMPDAPRSSFDRAALVISAAVDQLGVALESTRLAERALKRGELVELGRREFKAIEQETHFVYFRASEESLPKIALFRDWLFQQIA